MCIIKVDLLAQYYGELLDYAQLPQHPAVYATISEGDTIGLFQIESRADVGIAEDETEVFRRSIHAGRDHPSRAGDGEVRQSVHRAQAR